MTNDQIPKETPNDQIPKKIRIFLGIWSLGVSLGIWSLVIGCFSPMWSAQMKKLWSGALLAVLCFASLGADAPKAAPQSFEVPYRLTVLKHIMVRAKLNGKGPFNFILDTGAPALFVSTKVADKIGVKSDKKGWGNFDRLEIEGGVVLKNAKARIEDPFQLEGMNGLGLAGAETAWRHRL